MNKKLGIFLLLLCSTLLLAGCGKQEYKSFSNWAEKNIQKGHIYEFNCPELTEKSILGNGVFINDNKIYDFDPFKPFSNDKNCKAYGTIEGIVPIILEYDYLIDENGMTFRRKKDGYKFHGDFDKEFFIKRKVNNKVIGAITEKSLYGAQKTYVDLDNKFYVEHVITGPNYGLKYDEVETNFDKEEKIIANYNGKIIKTNKAYYRLNQTITNKEKCEKYNDVKCKEKYSLVKEDIMNKYSKDFFIMGDAIITKDKKVIYLQDYFSANPLDTKDA